MAQLYKLFSHIEQTHYAISESLQSQRRNRSPTPPSTSPGVEPKPKKHTCRTVAVRNLFSSFEESPDSTRRSSNLEVDHFNISSIEEHELVITRTSLLL